MIVSQVSKVSAAAPPRGARARTMNLMLETARRLMQEGRTPSVSEVAEAAGVSRATAYRCFPSQAALVEAVVNEALGPILNWTSESTDPEERIADLLSSTMPRILEYEATFKAALKLSLEQWAQRQAGVVTGEPPFRRGHRVELLQNAISPLRKTLSKRAYGRLAKALSLTYGLEVLIILKDLWGLEAKEMQDIAAWAGRALVRSAIAETKAG
jgi:AcrR family transcriptional regulator